jgi:hypothetical protein
MLGHVRGSIAAPGRVCLTITTEIPLYLRLTAQTLAQVQVSRMAVLPSLLVPAVLVMHQIQVLRIIYPPSAMGPVAE